MTYLVKTIQITSDKKRVQSFWRIEGKDKDEALENFRKQHPDKRNNIHGIMEVK